MTVTYSNLRIERWKNRASTAAAGAALLALAENADAAPFSLAAPNFVTAGGAKWKVWNSTTAFTGNTGLGIVEASLTSPVRTDGYDGAFVVAVNGVNFKDPTGTVDLTGTTLTSNVEVLSGLSATVQYFFDPASSTVRQILSLQNPSGAPITVTVRLTHNYGSDSATAVVAASQGGTTVTTASRWFISWDGSPVGDPTISTVLFGPSAAVTPVSTAFGPNADKFTETFSVTVPAGLTRRVMFSVDCRKATRRPRQRLPRSTVPRAFRMPVSLQA